MKKRSAAKTVQSFRFSFISGALVFCLIGIVGCSSAPKKDEQHHVRLVPFWVKDTLKSANVGFRKVNRFTPIIYENQIIVANALDGLVSYDKTSKTEKWRIPVRYGVEAPGIIGANYLFVGGLDGVVYCIDLDKGAIEWKFETRNEILAEPLLYRGVLYIMNATNSLYALEASSGKQLWVYNRQEISSKMTVRAGSRPAVDKDLLYVGFSDGSLVALNAKTGSSQWEVLLNKNSRFKDLDASPVIDQEAIYINSFDDKLYCLSKENGSILWKADTGGASTPLIVGERLFYSNSKGSLISLNKKDGTIVWKKTTSRGVYTDPVSHKGLLVSGESQGSVQLFDLLNGTEVTNFDPGRGVMSRPTIYDDVAYFISGEANIYGVRLEKTTQAQIPYLQ